MMEAILGNLIAVAPLLAAMGISFFTASLGWRLFKAGLLDDSPSFRYNSPPASYRPPPDRFSAVQSVGPATAKKHVVIRGKFHR